MTRSADARLGAYAALAAAAFVAALALRRPELAVLGAGFSGHGFKFCSVVGEILADLVVDGKTRHEIGFLRMSRFRDNQATSHPD